MDKYKTAAEITPETIESFKTQNPRGVWQVVVDDKTGFVRKPTREEMKYSMTMATTDPLGMAEEILKSCWLGGDQELLDDDDYFYGAAMQIQGLVEIKAGELKKL